jgi:hypothetical protein
LDIFNGNTHYSLLAKGEKPVVSLSYPKEGKPRCIPLFPKEGKPVVFPSFQEGVGGVV